MDVLEVDVVVVEVVEVVDEVVVEVVEVVVELVVEVVVELVDVVLVVVSKTAGSTVISRYLWGGLYPLALTLSL